MTDKESANAILPDNPSIEAPSKIEASEANVEEPKTTHETTYRVKLIMFAICVSTFVVALDTFIISTALPIIVSDLSASNAQYAWTVSSLLLARGVTTPLWGKTSDIFGRKPMIIIANLFFLIGVIAAALAKTSAALITGRVVQGVGSGGVLVLGSICVSDVFSTRQRGTYLGVIGVVYAITSSAGPIIGGALTQVTSWRWCFWINVPLVVVSVVLLALLLDIKSPRKPFWQGIKEIDWLGNLFFTMGTLLALIGLQTGGVIMPWSSYQVLILLILSPVAFAIFAWIEKKVAAQPMMPPSLFNNLSKISILSINVSQSLLTTASTFFLPLYFQVVLAASPLQSGLYYLPSTVVLALFFICTGHIISKTGKYVLLIRLSFLPLCLGAGLLIDSKAQLKWALIIIPQIVLSVGLGLYQAPLIAFQAHLRRSEVAAGTATFQFIKTICQTISIILGQVIFQAQIGSKARSTQYDIPKDLLQSLVKGKTVSATQVIRQLPSHQQLEVRRLLVTGLNVTWMFFTVIAVLGMIASLGMKKVELDNEEEERDI